MSIETLSSDLLDQRLRDLRGTERHVQVEFLLHLSEFDRRRGYAALGYPSLWEYCRKELGLLECATWRRTQSAQILRRFPIAAEYLRDGRLAMTTLVLVQELLTETNVREVLDRAANRSKREVEELVAAMRPRPDVPTTVRKLPAQTGIPVSALAVLPIQAVIVGIVASALGPAAAEGSAGTILPGISPTRATETPSSDASGASGAEVPVSPEIPVPSAEVLVSPEVPVPSAEVPVPGAEIPIPAKVRPAHRSLDVEPLSADRFLLKMTVGREFLDALEKAKAILSHAEPTGDLIAVIRRGLEEVIARETKRNAPRVPKSGPRKGRLDSNRSRTREGIPAAVRAEVCARDGGHCTWKMRSGAACGSTWKLELDHVEPVALGGRSTTENLRLLCRAHNLQHARERFGDRVVDRYRPGGIESAGRTSQEVRGPRPAEGP